LSADGEEEAELLVVAVEAARVAEGASSVSSFARSQ
jgi:hypothetical protein